MKVEKTVTDVNGNEVQVWINVAPGATPTDEPDVDEYPSAWQPSWARKN